MIIGTGLGTSSSHLVAKSSRLRPLLFLWSGFFLVMGFSLKMVVKRKNAYLRLLARAVNCGKSAKLSCG